VVANPPFSDKTWSTGLTPVERPLPALRLGRRRPTKQGDYAYLLHIIRSLKSTGKAPASCRTACCSAAMPRPSSAAARPLGHPQGHHRPAGQPLLRHRHPRLHPGARQGKRRRPQGRLHDRRQQGLPQGRPKNRLREQDIHRIVDTFTRQADVPRYARMVPFDEIADAKNDFNLNLLQ
jgi:type I restriction enzyme M protein